ncbi:MAG: NADH-quinone oxidoreductase subunit N [Verrucomicrobia bacterium ADurb.Bin118]|jgi:NADH-quinone oxidoreductase subunit N|nr:MAG: NADH-quinone oxidoreductase subunit N [Verrucomicrobia bacterium ADurb.Bin118]
MNLSLLSLEILVTALGLLVLLVDLWLPPERKRWLGRATIAALALLLVSTFTAHSSCAQSGEAFGGLFVQDALAVFFKRFFLLTTILVLVLAEEYSDRLAVGLAEYYALIVFALLGMLFAASAANLVLLFVAVELITSTFYILVGFTRGRVRSLEAGAKYLIFGALASAFMVFGIALVWGTTGKFNFSELAMVTTYFVDNPLFLFGVLFILVGLGFKVAAVPFQMWIPDVYQGAPDPTTTFLAVGSKAAGFVLLLRFLFAAIPDVTVQWTNLLMIGAGVTILYGNLCALPQRNLKRLLGYSSIAHAGYLLLGVAALSSAGQAAVLYYLSGYLFTLTAAFMIITLVMRHLDSEDISGLAGLHQRSPFLAAVMALAMVSLAGIPPLAGFMGKFLLLKAVIEQGSVTAGYYGLAFVALAGVVISLYYYFGVVRAVYWSQAAASNEAITLSGPIRVALGVCVAGMLWLGLFPGGVLRWAESAVLVLK